MTIIHKPQSSGFSAMTHTLVPISKKQFRILKRRAERRPGRKSCPDDSPYVGVVNYRNAVTPLQLALTAADSQDDTGHARAAVLRQVRVKNGRVAR